MSASRKRTAPPGLEGLDPEALEAAMEAARDFGLTLEQWVAATSPQGAHRPAEPLERSESRSPRPVPQSAPAARPGTDALDTAIEKLNGVAQLARRRATTAAEGLEAALATAAQRQARKQGEAAEPAPPPAPLSPESRLGDAPPHAEKPLDSGEHDDAPALAGAIAAMTRRLHEIERKIGEAGQPRIEAALEAVERIENQIGRTSDRPVHADASQIEAVLRGFEERIAQVADRLVPRRSAGWQSGLSQEGLQSAVSEIRARQAELETSRSAPAGAARDPYANIVNTLRLDIAELAQRMEVLRAGERTQDDVGAVRADIERLETLIGGLATREEVFDAVAGRGLDRAVVDGLLRQLDDIRQLLAEMAEPQQVQELARTVANLDRALAEIGRRQSHMGDFARRLDGTARELEGLGTEGPNSALAALAQEVASLGARVERGGALPAADLVQRIEELSLKLDRLGEKPRISVSSSPEGIEALFERLDQLEAKFADRTAPQLKSIEDLLHSLVDRIDVVERSEPNADGLDALETQVAAIVGRLGHVPTDPALSSIERTMTELMGQIELLRTDSNEAAAAAAKTAVAETIAALPMSANAADLSSFKRDLDDLKTQQSIVDQRVQATLENVHAALESMVDRLGNLEGEVGLGSSERRPETETGPRTTHLAASRADEVASSIRAGAASAEAGHDVLKGSDEILLEPGAGRPRHQASPQPSGAAADASDIKASFIAAARRAAQAAAEEAASNRRRSVGGIDPSALAQIEGARTGLAARMRAGLEKHRRPILLGLAAVVLALGAMQAATLLGGSTPTTAEGPAPSAAPLASTTLPSSESQPGGPESRQTAEGNAAEAGTSTKEPEPRTTQAIMKTAAATTPDAAPSLAESARRDDGIASKPAAPGGDVRQEDAKAPASKPETKAVTPSAAAAGTPLQISTAAPAGKSGEATSAPIPERIAKIASVGDLPSSATLNGLRQAALKGDPVAVYEMASRLVDGRGFNRDPQLAAKLFEKVADAGLVPAQYRIGNHYEKGLGVARDVAAAKGWYQRAAQGGNARAMHNLAVLLAQGAEGKPDYPAAADWFRRAAEHGVKDSQFNLAVLLARGLGVPQQFASSYTWFAIAAAQGDEDAARKRDEVAGKLSAADLAGAKTAVEKFRPVTPDQAKNEVALPAQGWAEAEPSQPPAPRNPQRGGKRA